MVSCSGENTMFTLLNAMDTFMHVLKLVLNGGHYVSMAYIIHS